MAISLTLWKWIENFLARLKAEHWNSVQLWISYKLHQILSLLTKMRHKNQIICFYCTLQSAILLAINPSLKKPFSKFHVYERFANTKNNFKEKFTTFNLRNRRYHQSFKRMKIIILTLYLNKYDWFTRIKTYKYNLKYDRLHMFQVFKTRRKILKNQECSTINCHQLRIV